MFGAAVLLVAIVLEVGRRRETPLNRSHE
jgi:hypothetical protein